MDLDKEVLTRLGPIDQHIRYKQDQSRFLSANRLHIQADTVDTVFFRVLHDSRNRPDNVGHMFHYIPKKVGRK
jgi:hypothetical protein